MRLATRFAAVAACLVAGAALAQTAAQVAAKPTTAPGAAGQPTNPIPTARIPAGQMHIIGSAKLIVKDANAAKAFFEQYFGMKQTSYYSAKDRYVEPIMGYTEGGARIALFQPLAEAELKKPGAPVALIYTPDFEKVVKGLEDAKQRAMRLPAGNSNLTIAITRDPSGNAIEILSRPGQPAAVGGSKLIVSDRVKAEEFFGKVFGVKPGQRFVTATYDEVLMDFGQGPFLALFQPKNEEPLPKSQFPVVAIYTKDFDNVLKRVKEIGLGFREVKSETSTIIIAKDPAGNGIEIIKQ